MANIQQISIETEFENALKSVKNSKKSMLFSYTEQLNDINPLSFYSSAKELFKGERFFWKDTNDDLIIVGLGSAHTLQTELEDDRFKYIENQWDQLIENAYIYNPFEDNGTGPLIFGGFSFDSQSVKETEWKFYSEALFLLPKMMLVINKKKVYLTINLICMSNDTKETLNNVINIKKNLTTSIHSNNLSTAEISKEYEINPDGWKQSVAKVVELLKEENEINKVVMARKMKLEFNERISSEIVLEHLLEEQHESYIFALEAFNYCYTGASPERLVKKSGNDILSTCLAGSIKRDKDEKIDDALGKALLMDEKNRHEHQLVVSMIAEVIGSFCEQVEIPNEPALLKMRDIQHLYTPVRGKIQKHITSILPLVEALHPTPAMGGVPTKEALKVIREMENMDRGFYAAPIGWMDYRSNGEFAVAIRSGLLKDNEAFLYAGCGVVADSNPEDEYFETKIKFRPMLRALGGKDL